jgi:hypothetical protein
MDHDRERQAEHELTLLHTNSRRAICGVTSHQEPVFRLQHRFNNSQIEE